MCVLVVDRRQSMAGGALLFGPGGCSGPALLLGGGGRFYVFINACMKMVGVVERYMLCIALLNTFVCVHCVNMCMRCADGTYFFMGSKFSYSFLINTINACSRLTRSRFPKDSPRVFAFCCVFFSFAMVVHKSR